jgi:DNA-binding response OmpR family regulator
MKVLIVEDDPKIAEIVKAGLTQAGFSVRISGSAEEALDEAQSTPPDLFIVDIMLPIRDGLEFVEEIRKQSILSPVLILSAKRSIDDRVLGLQKGGDDYLTKPFAFPELLARCQALVRRALPQKAVQSLSYDNLNLDLLSREVRRGASKIELQAKEFSLLEYFLRNPEVVLTKTQILEQVWNYNFDPQTNVVDVLVCRLRNKLEKDFDDKLIHTVRGAGYVLKKN